jgi:osmotically-inducible protein OsmY
VSVSDYELERAVAEELQWDPKLDSKAVAVSAYDGEVTLCGTIGSFREQRDARKAAQRVHGVRSVANRLKVRPLTRHGRTDADVRGAVLRALHYDSLIPDTIDVRVDDGWVTLIGTAEWRYQRDEAEYVAGNVLGVLGVDDEVGLAHAQPRASDVDEAIRKAFERNAKIEAGDVSVDTNNGAVVLTGEVRSWAAHDEALAAAWAAPGVTRVDDFIEVDY